MGESLCLKAGFSEAFYVRFSQKIGHSYQNVEGMNERRDIQQDLVLALLVKQMFEYYAKGIYSLKDASKESARIGLVHRRSGNKVNKSSMFDILTNPIYYGDFYWKGILYSGTQKPIIWTKSLTPY